MLTRVRGVLPWVLYVGLAVVLAGVLFQLWAEVLPSGLAAQVGHNSEAYTLVILLAAWIQYVRPRLSGSPREWPVTIMVALVFVGLGVLFIANDDWASRFRTLNETWFGLALLIPYVQLSRRPSRGLAAAMALAVLIFVVVVQDTSLGTDLAETFGAVMLAPFALDVVDRGILDPSARTSARARHGWYAAMIVAPVVLSYLQYDLEMGGVLGDLTRYGVRIHEAFIAFLILELYFAVGLGRTGRNAEPAGVAGRGRVASLAG